MSRSLAPSPVVVPAVRAQWTHTASDFTVPAPVVEGYACTLCDAFAPRHLTLTHAAGCRGRYAP